MKRATVLNASAGSGKTYRLAYRYVRSLIENPSLYRSILAVTFTNKATEEMKSRILGQIHLLASGANSPYLEELMREFPHLSQSAIRKRAGIAQGKILHDYSRFTILTIDRFFQRIIRAFIQELGIDLNYNIEIESTDMITQSTDSLLESISTNQELREWILEFAAERIEDNNKWDIRGAISQLGGEIFKESITKKLEGNPNRKELKAAINQWQNRAKQSKTEMIELAIKAEEVMRGEGIDGSDFSGKTRSFAHYFHKVAKGVITPPTATARKKSESITGWVAKGSLIGDGTLEQLRGILAQMCEVYDDNIKVWNTAQLLSENYRSAALLMDLYQTLQRLSEEQSVMLLSQSKSLLTEFIANNDAPFIYEKIGNRYEHFLLDEFQDTSSMEWRNLLPLLENAISQSEDSSVLIVGDVKQSIYRWRGGDWNILCSGVGEALGEDTIEVINLCDNWRSGSAIVEFINSTIAHVVTTDNDNLNRVLESALESEEIDESLSSSLHDITLNAYSSHAQSARREAKGFVEVCSYSEQSPYLDSVKEALDLGYRPCEIMILTRTRIEGVRVAEELLLFKSENREAKYSFDIMTQEALLVGNSDICRFVIALFSLAVDAEDRVELAIYNKFLGLPRVDMPIDEQRKGFLLGLRQLSIVEAFDMVVVEFNLSQHSSQIAFLQAIHEQVIAYANSKIGDLSLFVKWWQEHGSTKSLSVEQSERTIEITTIHKAKGLEKRVVIIPYCSWDVEPKSSGVGGSIIWANEPSVGHFPLRSKGMIAQSYMASEYYRERVNSHIDAINLLYVALTRAEDALYIFTKACDTKIGGMLLNSLTTTQQLMGGEVYQRGDNTYHLFSEKSPADISHKVTSQQSDQVVKMREYPTRASELAVNLPYERYREDTAADFSPRDVGILMHHIFEGSSSIEDILQRVKSMRLSAKISQTEAKVIEQRVEEAIKSPVIRGWFDPLLWDKVICEQAIIIPSSREIRRPDRVMIKGERAVVVDYKFGEVTHKSYHRQVAQYMELLRQMGYKQVEGWVWQIKSGVIEAV